jgi:transcriptional regulator with XRE-family HTH domain
MLTARQPEPFYREDRKMDSYLLIGIKARIVRGVLGKTQAEMAQKVGMTLPEYKKLEEAQHAPDSEKTLKLVRAGLGGFSPYDARTKIPGDLVRLLFGRGEGE